VQVGVDLPVVEAAARPDLLDVQHLLPRTGCLLDLAQPARAAADHRLILLYSGAAAGIADGSLIRLESVQNATEQGKSAAAALLGQERPFTATPWFWSDQYDRKLQMAGLSGGADAWAVRGDLSGASFSVYHFRAGRLIAVDSVNAAKDHLQARKLLDAGISPRPKQAADSGFDLGSLLK
jgi:3-phenylpropionate/trans-cinnamate dioxygenase ferredoxin reductase component